MGINVLILGSGSALPTINSHQSAQIVEVNNRPFLIDCGEGTQVESRRNKVRIQQINHIFISHLHGDHFFGLVGLMSTMHLLGRDKDIHIHGPKGIADIVLMQFKIASSYLSFKMHFHEVNEESKVLFEDKSVKISALPLAHRIPTFGFLVEEKVAYRKLIVEAIEKYHIPKHARRAIVEGKDYTTIDGKLIPNKELTKDPLPPKKYAYCSDTAYSEVLIDSLPALDLLYHEATFLEEDRERAKQTFHSTAKDAATVALKTNSKKLILGHYSNRYKKKDKFLEEARSVFKETYHAEEGETFIL